MVHNVGRWILEWDTSTAYHATEAGGRFTTTVDNGKGSFLCGLLGSMYLDCLTNEMMGRNDSLFVNY